MEQFGEIEGEFEQEVKLLLAKYMSLAPSHHLATLLITMGVSLTKASFLDDQEIAQKYIDIALRSGDSHFHRYKKMLSPELQVAIQELKDVVEKYRPKS